MEMCQCVKKTSSEGVCELSPSVSDRLGFPDIGNGVCDNLRNNNSFSKGCDKIKGFYSYTSSSFMKSRNISKSESTRQDKSTSFSTFTNSSRSACTRESNLLTCTCVPKMSFHIPRRCKKESSTLGVDLLSSIVISRCLVFLLMILLRSVLVEGFPSHKVRHHHLKPDDLPHCSQRFRREIQSMSLKESETAGLCPSWACLDIDERRRPVHITRVFCLQSNNSTCAALGGDFHCTQLHAQLEVWQEEGKPRDGGGLPELWTAHNKTRAMVPSKIKVEHGCLCASKKAKPVVNPINIVV